MAQDLLSGQQDGRDWSRGDGMREWATRRAVESVEKKIPWVPIGIAATVGLFVFLPLSKRTSAPSSGYHTRRSSTTEHTVAIPFESMRDVVHGKRK